MNKRKIVIAVGFLLIAFMATFFVLEKGTLFASNTDWISQHVQFPTYFRSLFYQTGNLLPNFALHIGSGENIFYFSYYGFLNPFILLSYFFPMIPMSTYLIAINFLIIIATLFLLYFFLKKHTSSYYHAFFTTLLLFFSSSFLFHFHRHFMFVNYMPFLILGLISIDKYREKKKCSLLIVSCFLMIMTSYFYSPSCFVVLLIYGIYSFLEKENKKTIKEIIKEIIKFNLPFIVAILMSGILIIPTLAVILSGRGKEKSIIDLTKIIFPKLNLEALLYDTYSLGLTSIFLFAYLNFLGKKEKSKKMMALCLLFFLCFPLAIYLLNGGLYIRNKVFIPFLPLFGLILLQFLEDRKKGQIKEKNLGLFVSLLLLFSNFSFSKWWLYIDCLITYGLIRRTRKNSSVFYLALLTLAITSWFFQQKTDNYVSKNFLQDTFSKTIDQKMTSVLAKEENIVRSANLRSNLYTLNYIISPNYYQTTVYSSTYHQKYHTFQNKVFKNPLFNRNNLIIGNTKNPLYHILMGIKYVIADKDVPLGYEKIEKEKLPIYQNKQVMPIGYASNRLILEEDFLKLAYPNLEEAFIGNIIVKNKKSTVNFKGNSIEIYPKITLPKNKNIKETKKKNHVIIKVKKDTKIKLKLPFSIDNQILFLSFKVHNQTSCQEANQKISINQVINQKTCKEHFYQNDNDTFHYALSKNRKWDELEVTIGKGQYDLSDFHYYLLDYQKLISSLKNLDYFKAKQVGSDKIVGRINVSKDGYFATTIPYDKGFTVYLDGKKISYEEINTAFLGFPIQKGKHKIELIYHAKGLNIGIILSVIGTFLYIIIVKKEKDVHIIG